MLLYVVRLLSVLLMLQATRRRCQPRHVVTSQGLQPNWS